ncbi:MAG: TPM domain-containing protein [Planctomycetota bacterium]|jgi:putative membrane protein
MRLASDRFSEDDRARVAKAVALAESKTSAEIVPVVATASGRYDRPEDIVGLFVGAILGAVVWLLFAAYAPPAPDWGLSLSTLELPLILIALVAGFVLGAFTASRAGWLRALFTPGPQMRDEVAARARAVFFDSRVHHTEGQTGVLVYVSLHERTAAVIADKAVVEKVGQGALDEVRDALVTGLRAGDLTEGLCAAVKTAGEKLGAVLPREEADVNELPDALVLLD